MATALWGFKTFNRSEVPSLIWIGDDVASGLKVLADTANKAGLVRAERQQVIGGFPVPIPETEAGKVARLAKEAEARDAQAKAQAQEAARVANAALEKARKEAAEAQAALDALAANPADKALQAAAQKEKAEADAAAQQAAELTKHRRK